METLAQLLEEQVKDLYSAENQLLKAMPRFAKKLSTPEVIEAFQNHLVETQGQVGRLEQVGQILGIKLTGKVCAAMKGLIEEGKEVLEEDGKNPVIDAALIAAAQRIEHYEISGYGTVKAIAQVLGHDDLVELFDATLAEEKKTDDLLTQVCEASVLPNAPKTDDDGEEGEEMEDDDEAMSTPAAKGRSGGGRATSSKSSGAKASGTKSAGNRTPPSREAASKGGKNSAGKSKSR